MSYGHVRSASSTSSGSGRPCPSCDKVDTLERVARSDWFWCRSCARTFLIHDGNVARRGSAQPWYVPMVLCLIAALACPAAARADMARVAMKVGTCDRDACSEAAIRFYRSSSRHRLELRVPRNPDNRMLTVTLYADGFVIDGPAEIPHEGEDAFPIRTREYRNLPPGHYVVTAVLTTARGQRIPARPVEFVVVDSAR